MNSQLETTISVLESTRNDAAVDVLVGALEQPEEELRQRAFLALLRRPIGVAQREVVRRWHTLDDDLKSLVSAYPLRLDAAVREAITSADLQHVANAYDLAAWSRNYDLIPMLVNLSEDSSNSYQDVAAETLLELAEEMHEELGRGQECFEHRDPEVTRRHVVSTLEQSIGRFDEHGHREHLEAFLMLAHKENATLREIIHDQSHCCHLLTMDLLAKSSKPGILRLLLSHLDDFEAPLSVLDVLASRHDAPFAQCLLTKFSKHQGDLSNTSLNRLEECGWVKSFTEHIQRWSDQEQEAAVRVVVASNLERARVFAVVEQVLRRGKPKARRQAVQALIQFTGLESETLLLQALEDRDPGVQVAAIEQIRGRDIPDAMACLMKLLESPHERVRHAVRVNLAEFNMNAFLSAFDVLDTENQSKMASLVKKIDLDFVAVLARELECGVRSRVLRGLEVTKLMCILPLLEQQVIALLSNDDHYVRNGAAQALADAQSSEARQALTAALKDSSLSVREAAEQSLHVFGSHGPTTLTSPGWADALTIPPGTEES